MDGERTHDIALTKGPDLAALTKVLSAMGKTYQHRQEGSLDAAPSIESSAHSQGAERILRELTTWPQRDVLFSAVFCTTAPLAQRFDTPECGQRRPACP
jgi:hypothetical protein